MSVRTSAPLPGFSFAPLFITVVRRGMVVLVMVLLIVTFASQTDRFWQGGNLINILQQNAATIIVAVGMTMTMLVGGIDLSVGSVAALGGAVSAGLIARNGASFEVALVAGLALGFGLGLINGLLVVRGGLPPFVATLAMLGIARGLTLLYTEGRPISGLGATYAFWGRGTVDLPVVGAFPAPILVALVVVIVFSIVLRYTRYGLHIYAIGGSEETARLAGVPVVRVKLLTFALSGLLAALAGVLLTGRLNSAQPQVAVGLELDAIAAAVLGGVSLFGGVGNLIGAALGALLVGILSNGLNLLRVPSYQQQMIQGVVLVAAVAIDMFTKRLERRW